MALRATVFKAQLAIADMDRGYYGDHALTVARHPSETDERMLVRLMAFALNASESLSFGKGVSSDDEPALWQKDLSGNTRLWIDVGQPAARRLRKACGVADAVRVYTYGGRAADVWWNQTRGELTDLANLSVQALKYASERELCALVSPRMRLQVTIQEGTIWLGDETRSVEVQVTALQDAQAD